MQVKAEGQTSLSSEVEGISKRPTRELAQLLCSEPDLATKQWWSATDTNRGLSFQLWDSTFDLHVLMVVAFGLLGAHGQITRSCISIISLHANRPLLLGSRNRWQRASSRRQEWCLAENLFFRLMVNDGGMAFLLRSGNQTAPRLLNIETAHC